MKRIVLSLVVALCCLTSCGSLLHAEKDYRSVRDYSDRMMVLSNHFPEIYTLYKNGDVVVDDVYSYTDRKTGNPHFGIKYHYRSR